jgi:transcriptional regulator with XRE-family HTH domain
METAAPLAPRIVAAKLRDIGVSAPYASQLAHGKREPGIDLAVKIHESTGLRLGLLALANDEEVFVVTRLVARRA